MQTPLSSLTQLIQALRSLPGVGPRSAERLAYHLLHSKERSLHLANLLTQAIQTIRHCERCHSYTERSPCHFCTDQKRDPTLLCITETPHDLFAIEQSGAYRGHYYVLMGKISPLEGIGPEELGLDNLVSRVQGGAIREIIFALSPTVEGQTTLHCIQSLLQPFNIQLSQLAQGIPLGGELAMLDGLTISSALNNRSIININQYLLEEQLS